MTSLYMIYSPNIVTEFGAACRTALRVCRLNSTARSEHLLLVMNSLKGFLQLWMTLAAAWKPAVFYSMNISMEPNLAFTLLQVQIFSEKTIGILIFCMAVSRKGAVYTR